MHTAIETSLPHEERAMGSSNDNVAVAKLKYKPMRKSMHNPRNLAPM